MNQSSNIQRSVYFSIGVSALLSGFSLAPVFATDALPPISGGSRHSLANPTITPDTSGFSGHAAPALAIPRSGYYGWGSNQSGQVGNQNAGTTRYYPIWTPYQPWRRRSAGDSDVMPLATQDDLQAVQVVSGDQHSITLYSDGTVSASGDNTFGQLGDGTQINRSEPVQVQGLSNIVAVAAGKSHSLAVTGEGQVYAWGSNTFRQLGNNTTVNSSVPVLVAVTGSDSGLDFPPLTDVQAVAASEVHSVALKRDGTVWAWGTNTYGQLGTGTTLSSAVAKPVPNLTEVRVITAGGDQATARTLARTADGTLWGWGNNDKCQMSDSPWATQKTPIRLEALSRLGAVDALASGLAHGVALKDGLVYTWGDNQSGQLGDGTSTSRCEPLSVAGLSPVATIAAGNAHTLVTQSDGTIRTWGKNEYGQLGDGTASDAGQPAAVKGVCGVGQINLQSAPLSTCPLTVETAGGGTVGGDGEYATGATVTLTATPNPGKIFMGWDPEPCAAYFLMPASALLCTARFADDSGMTYSLVVTKTGAGTVSDGGQYAAGTTVTLKATPDAGNVFVNWSPEPCADRFTMPAQDLTCMATFTNSNNDTAYSAVGVFRAGTWFLDANGNGIWDNCQQEGGLDLCLFNAFGSAGDLPAAGNWNGDAKSSIGVLRSGTGEWFIDQNGNHQWDGCGVDGCYVGFGMAGDLPVAGDWHGTGSAKIGVFRNGQWFLDANGNGKWDDCSADLCLSFGQALDLPVAGNWNGGVPAGVGVFRQGTWYLDYNGNGVWDGCQQDGGQDQCLYNSFGSDGDLPAAGDWNGDGKAKVGVFRNGTWYLDYNGNGAWDGCGIDRCYAGSFGTAGDLPVAGRW